MRADPHILQTHGRTIVGASVLSADFSRLASDTRDALRSGADFIHVDVMDGHLVPNLSMGPAVCGALRKSFPTVALDVHLMVEEPERFLEPFAAAGADGLTIHAEARGNHRRLLRQIRALGCRPAIAISPRTAVARIRPMLDECDMVLVMSIHPGYSGQAFMPIALRKGRALRRLLGDHQRLQVDGGVNAANASACREAGFDTLVSATAIFGAKDRSAVIAAMRGGDRRSHRRTAREAVSS